MKKPRTLTAKYPGHCVTCGVDIESGDTILWHKRGVVECTDCASHPVTVTAQDFKEVYQWDDTSPKPQTPTTPIPQTAQTPPRHIIEPSKPIAIHTINDDNGVDDKRERPPYRPDSPLHNDPQVQTVSDLLVTLINATQRLTREQCWDVKHFADAMAELSDDQTRKRLYELAAHGVEV